MSERGATSPGADDTLISVIVPAHNVEAFVERALASALDQTHRALEVVVVDDGSTDRTAGIVASIGDRDPRVRLIRTGAIGVSAARNLAIANARGALIAPLDADDVWHPEKLARQLAVLRSAGREVGVVYCWSVGIDEHDRVILPTWNRSTASGNVLRNIIVSGIAGNGSTPLIRREAIAAVGGYDESLSLCEDWKFYTALAGVCEFAVVPDYLTGYRLRSDSASMDVAAMEKAIDEVTAWIVGQWPRVAGEVLRDRSHTVNAYLAFLAIRQREFRHAARFLRAALAARPGKALSVSYVRLLALMAAHAVGLRRYRWLFWRRPKLEFKALAS